MNKGVTLLLVAVLLASNLSLGEEDKPREMTVAGLVLDSAGKPLAGVEITVWPTGANDANESARTGQDGAYDLKVKLTAPFDLSYTHAKYDLAVISRLSESKDQRINKVLYAKGEQRNMAAYHDYLQGVERMMVIAMSVENKDKRAEVFSKMEKLGTWTGLVGKFPPPDGKFLTKDQSLFLEGKFNTLVTEHKKLSK